MKQATTAENITLAVAEQAVLAYNSGCYGSMKNRDLDRDARSRFSGGLGSTAEEIRVQVVFIGDEYGGVAGFPSALSLAPAIAADIFAIRDEYHRAATNAPPIIGGSGFLRRSTLEVLYSPFVKPLAGKKNWQVWASKVWHFLNPDAFVLEDSRVDKFFSLAGRDHSVGKYIELLLRFEGFARQRVSWLEPLRVVDAGEAWSDNKLWDKVFYGVVELEKG